MDHFVIMTRTDISSKITFTMQIKAYREKINKSGLSKFIRAEM